MYCLTRVGIINPIFVLETTATKHCLCEFSVLTRQRMFVGWPTDENLRTISISLAISWLVWKGTISNLRTVNSQYHLPCCVNWQDCPLFRFSRILTGGFLRKGKSTISLRGHESWFMPYLFAFTARYLYTQCISCFLLTGIIRPEKTHFPDNPSKFWFSFVSLFKNIMKDAGNTIMT